MTAAFELTRPEHAGSYEVTVYQHGWRLGGKGASGRGPAGRIEEHGLHVWMGFYENAFRLMRECYAELGRDPAQLSASPTGATPSCRPTTLRRADRAPAGRWQPWMANFPPAPGCPAIRSTGSDRWTVADYLSRALRARCATLLEAVPSAATPAAAGARPQTARPVDPPRRSATTRAPPRATASSRRSRRCSRRVRLLEVVARRRAPLPATSALCRCSTSSRATAQRAARTRCVRDDDEAPPPVGDRRSGAGDVRGSIRFGLVDRSARLRRDRRLRLPRVAAAQRRLRAVARRRVRARALRSGFAYEDGDVTRPRIAAGQALRGALRVFFTYRGAFFWKMHAGMGDVVFAPFYEVLRRRGVRFEFFHRLRERRAIGRRTRRAAPTSSALEFDVQAQRARAGASTSRWSTCAACRAGPPSPTGTSSSTASACAREGWEFESHWDDAGAPRRKRLRVARGLRLRRARRRPRRGPARLPASSSRATRAGATWSST